jgi:carboxylesterase
MPNNYLDGAEPLFLKGKEQGLLLLHGAGGGTAWDLKEFATKAHNRGFTVWLPSLPGFGTDPIDLVDITLNDWLSAASDGVTRLRDVCSSVSIVGHSFGGLLALLTAAQDHTITSVVCWATPWKVKNRLLSFLPLIKAIPGIRTIVPERHPVNIPSHLRDMGWIGYDWIPLSLGLVALDGLKRLHVLISKIQCPVLVVQGSKDEAVTSKSAQIIFNNLKNPNKEIWIIEEGIHPLMQDFCKEELFERSLTFLEEKTKLEP